MTGLSQRAKHPQSHLELLHGSLSTVSCDNYYCNYIDYNNFLDPIVPALAIPLDKTRHAGSGEVDISDPEVPLQDIDVKDLPHCPKCKTLLRPGVVFFGEPLPSSTMSRVDEWISDKQGIDLIIVIGTSATVYPAAGYIETARSKGAKVAVVNMERPDQQASRLQKGDWFFQGDAGNVLPEILASVIGELPEQAEKL